jgi:hypothetical protein
MSLTYRVRYRCPHGDFYEWALRENLNMTLQEVYNMDWDFTCPSHGPQRAKPFEAQVKKSFERAAPRK